MKKFALKALFGLLALVMVATMLPTQVMAAPSLGGVTPTKTHELVSATVSVGGKPASVGTGVEFFCRENLAGYALTLNGGILPPTKVYGSDLKSSPQILACEQDDLIKVKVNGLWAVSMPELRWSKSGKLQMITIKVDLNLVVIGRPGGVDEVYVNMLEKPSTLRDWGQNGTGYGEQFSEKPFALVGLRNPVQQLSLTDQLGKTYAYVFHNKGVCQELPQFSLTKGGNLTKIVVNNNTGQTVQMLLRLENLSNPAGLLNPGGMANIQTDKLFGGLEVRFGDQPGPLCASVSWDFRNIPAPHILFVTKGMRSDSSVMIQGDNFEPFQNTPFAPDSYLLWFIKPDWTGSAFSFRNTIWEYRQIVVDLPDNFASGTYMIKVSIPNVEASNIMQYQYTSPILPPPSPSTFKLYLPLVTNGGGN